MMMWKHKLFFEIDCIDLPAKNQKRLATSVSTTPNQNHYLLFSNYRPTSLSNLIIQYDFQEKLFYSKYYLVFSEYKLHAPTV